DNPLFGRGLKWQQRLCYLNAMLHFQFGLPRVAFLTAPLAYLLFNLNIIHSSASLIFAYVLPHLVMSLYVNSRMNGRFRYTFWGEIYETVMCFHLVIPTILTLLSPKHGKFNVTDKGGVLDQGFFDFHIVRPHVIVALLLGIGIVAGVVRAVMHDYFGVDPYVIALNVGWAIFSLIILMAAIAVARETKQVRKTIRVEVQIPAIIHYASGISSRTQTSNLSMGGAQLDAPDGRHETDEIEEIDLLLKSGAITIPVSQISGDDESIRLRFEAMPLARRRELVRVVLARADAWIQPEYKQDNPLISLGTIIRTVFELFWLTWKGRHDKRKNVDPVAAAAKEDGAA
ncbi:cellulose synthase, partial [Pantoea agglomerans]|nr:cellulose synthase [Pantoea agglomerans]